MLCGRDTEEEWRNAGASTLCPLSAQSISALMPSLPTLSPKDRAWQPPRQALECHSLLPAHGRFASNHTLLLPERSHTHIQ